MVEHIPLELPENPRLAGNITHFARALRRAGLPIGPGRVIDAIRAVEVAGFTERRDFYWTLHACFVNRPEHRLIFRQIFRLYWRDPRYLEHMMAAMLPAIRGVQEERAGQAGEKRAAEALLDGAEAPDFDVQQDEDEGETQIEIDASFTTSSEEKLKTLDFEQMSTAEMAQAKRMLARMRLPVDPMPTRRMQPSLRGGVDPAKTLRAAMRTGGDIRSIARRAPRTRWPNLVVLCDISGSMSQYSRVVLHFLHAVSNAKGAGWAKVHAFTFGTRLTNITRHLDHRDVDAALAAAGAEAQDWEGGTRIGECIETFNRDWSRRVLGQGAVVLLITDGLDRGAPEVLARQMQRLHLSAKRLIWLNPLLRWDEFAPKARGIAAMLPHVDSFRAGHSIASLEELAQVISRKDDVGEKARLMGLIGR
ncbi:vWA domain-containing protein [Pseudosulfitobacter koreensis]|uniref:VWA domain-containing protein n=1 Tax=Pseudosulfitobacter koreensis TaxID=2968472 RepID=A0ABT1Z049_9RHOB|nr:VWA domain-containing protein [Pseudosulfitobacter koreense]MCR8826518.1 VWA domain-containing protein [Pseudosulfitobacter koreense]